MSVAPREIDGRERDTEARDAGDPRRTVVEKSPVARREWSGVPGPPGPKIAPPRSPPSRPRPPPQRSTSNTAPDHDLHSGQGEMG